MNLKEMLIKEVASIYPDIKPYLIDRYVAKYCSAVLAEIKQALLRPGNENEELTFSKEDVARKCGRNHNNQYLFYYFQKSPKLRLVEIKYTGNVGRLSRVIINPMYKELIMSEILEMPIMPLSAQKRQELHERANRVIPIDIRSLVEFINESTRKAATANQYLRDKIVTDIARARDIVGNAHEVDGQSYAMEYWETADTGREYGHYNSLQRQNREVRNAALGTSHKYDFQAHSFAVMASIAQAIDPTIRIGAIEEYIQKRTVIRERIAREVGVPADTIKSVFTSLGFGAKPVNTPFKSIRRLMKTDEAYTRLVENPEFKYIIEDLERVNQAVLSQFPDGDFEWHNGFRYHHRNENNRVKTQSQKLAWIYQNTESHITRWFIDIVRDRTGLEPIMTVHDCVYYREKLPAATVVDAQVLIQEQFGLVRVEHEAVYPITTQENFESRFDLDRQELEQHRSHIQQEEAAAHGYVSDYE